MTGRILIVDDEKSIRVTLAQFLRAAGYEVETAEDADAALEQLQTKPFEVVVSDIIMPQLTGLDLLKCLRKKNSDAAVILITGEPNVETAAEAVRHGAADYVAKPVTKEVILKTVHNALRFRESQLERERLRVEVEKQRNQLAAQLSERNRELEELAALTLAVAGSPAEALRQTARVLKNLSRADVVGISEIDGDRVRLITGIADDELITTGEAEPIADSPCEAVLREQRATIVGRLAKDVRLPPPLCDLSLQSYCGVPVLDHAGRLISTLFLFQRTPDAFGEDHVRILQLCAGRVKQELERLKHEQEAARLNAENAELEAKYLQAQKMESLGRLAGGVAHDFNNLLTAIMGSTDLLNLDVEKTPDIEESLDLLTATTDRAKELVEQLLSYSRKQTFAVHSFDLNDMIRRFEKLLRGSLREDVAVSLNLAPGEIIINADPRRLEQVLMNLAVNSQDAMEQGGEILIATSLLHSAATPLESDASAGDAYSEAVLLSVTDNGCGMAKDIQAKAFEPFFTTKERGRGTGLGLSTVYGIVQQLGGDLNIISNPDWGTKVMIYLPLASEIIDETPDTTPDNPVLRGSETILVADDDDQVLQIIERALRCHGYQVKTAVDGMDALEQLGRDPDSVDLFLSDVLMPRMRGPDAADVVAREYPRIKTMLMSGFTDTHTEDGEIRLGEHPLLRKPFTARALLAALRSVLDAGTEQESRP